jgi:hypothetical protein
VVDEFLDGGLYELDLGEDFVGRRGPSERSGVTVPVGDVVADLSRQDGDRGEAAASNGLAGDYAGPGLDLDGPGGSDWRGMDCTCGLLSNPPSTPSAKPTPRSVTWR